MKFQRKSGRGNHHHEADFGWTRTDLVFSLVGIFILVILSSASLARVGTHSSSAVCLRNMQTMTSAWTMYAADNQGVLVLNPDGADSGQTAKKPAWGGGWLDFSGSRSDNTNVNLLKKTLDGQVAYYYSGLLGPYVPDARVYKCPEDSSTVGTKKLPRVRSVSMNCYMGGIQIYNSNLLNTWVFGGFEVYTRKSSFVNVSPSQLFVFIEEKAESIDDGCFGSYLRNDYDSSRRLNPAGYQFIDYPAAYHENGAALSFADGHAELWQWKDPRTTPPIKPNQTMPSVFASPNNVDVGRLAVATSRFK